MAPINSKNRSGNRLTSREAGYTAANQAIPIEQAKKKFKYSNLQCKNRNYFILIFEENIYITS